MKISRNGLLASLFISLCLSTPLVPGAYADETTTPAIQKSTSAYQDHVLLVVHADVVDVTDTLYIQNNQVYGVLYGNPIPMVLDFDHNKVYSPSGQQIGYIAQIDGIK